MTDWSPPRTPQGQISRVPQMPGLDGLRALAVGAVMVYHANNTWMHGGFLGVEVFFVISGYLITLLLIAEHERSGRVNLKQFWIRRFRRLLPALFVMLGLLTIYLAVGYQRARGRTRGDIIGGLSYGSNWYQIWVGAGYTATEAFAPLRHLWSLAVEEQFYLLWPLVMVLILRRGSKQLPRVALYLTGIAFLITAAVAALYVPGDIDSSCTPENMHGYWKVFGRCISVNDTLYLGTITRAGGLMLGAAFAMVWRPHAIMRGPMRNKAPLMDVLSILGLGGLGWLAWHTHLADPAKEILTGSRFDPWLFRGGFLLTGVATLFVIAAVTHQRAVTGVILGNPLFRWIGTRSYGLYLYHWPIYQIIRKEAGQPLTPTQFAVAMALTIPLTELSYRIVERPIRDGKVGAWLRRERTRPSAQVIARRRQIVAGGLAMTVLVGFAGVSIAMAPNECVGSVECASAEGQALIDDVENLPATTVPVTASPVTTVTTVEEQAGPTVPGETPSTVAPSGTSVSATTTMPAPADLPPVAIGESVMLGAAAQLQSAGFFVDADVSRNGQKVLDRLRELRAEGRIGRTVIIQTGTNGPVSPEVYRAIMAELPADSVPTVLFLTVRAPKDYIADNNAEIRALPTTYPNVHIADWENASANVELCKDGVHVSCGAARFYANVIFNALGRPDLVQPAS